MSGNVAFARNRTIMFTRKTISVINMLKSYEHTGNASANKIVFGSLKEMK